MNTLLKLTCISRYLHKCYVIFSAHVNSFDFVVPYLRKTLIVGAESDNETTITTMIKFLLTAIQTFRLFNVSRDVQHFPTHRRVLGKLLLFQHCFSVPGV